MPGWRFFLVPVAVAFRFRPSVTSAAVAVTTAAYVIQAVVHPAAGQPEAVRFIVTQAGFLAWIGVACILLSMLLARRTELAAHLADARSRLLADAVAAEQRERKALAEALHDQAIQNLLSARHELEEARETLSHPALDRADAALVETVGQLRDAVFDLHPYVLEEAGLEAALRSIARQAASRARLELKLDLNYGKRHAQEQLVFSAARELLANVVRHAQASELTLRLVESAGELELVDGGQRPRLPAAVVGSTARGRPHRTRHSTRPRRSRRRADAHRVDAGRGHAGRDPPAEHGLEGPRRRTQATDRRMPASANRPGPHAPSIVFSQDGPPAAERAA